MSELRTPTRSHSRWALARDERVPAALLISSYLFGAAMLGNRIVDGFVYLTALHLVFTATLTALTHRPRPSSRYWVWLLVCYVLGYLAEYVGVHYRWLFGEYVYGDVLGPKLWGIPLVIGVNWIVVVYAICGSVNLLLPTLPRWAKVALASLGLVALDYLIEPVAIALDYWTWAAGAPPAQNYLGWLFVGAVQVVSFYVLIPYTENRLSVILLALQLIFFAYLSLVL